MLDRMQEDPLLFLGEFNTLRQEAMQLFEESLISGNEAALVAFIERQLAQDPPQLYLLRQLADELEMHLLALREHLFDVRERVVSTLREHYGVDMASLTPAEHTSEYHRLQAEDVMAYIRQQNSTLATAEETALRQMVTASLETAARLQRDITITHRVHEMITDWLEGLSVTLIRQIWPPYNASYDVELTTRH